MEKTAASSVVPPSPDTTARLLRSYRREGDTNARAQLIELYMPLVASLARRYARGEDYEDLVQVGSIGLIKAIDRFDPARGSELGAFAVPNISGEIKRHLRDRGQAVRLPRGLSELRGRLRASRQDLTARLGRDPTLAELAADLGVDEDEVAQAEVATTAESGSLDELLSPDSSLAADDRLALADAFEGLEEDERRLLYLRYVRDLDADAVARELGISKRHLSRRTQAALAKLRAGLAESSEPQTRPNMAPMEETRASASYLERPYHIVLVRENGGWTARVEELPGCEAHGETADEATGAIRESMEAWITDALAKRREVPEPRDAASYSGRLMLRMPHTLHAELARAAEREEVSLNQFITSSLASAVGWPHGNGETAETAPAGPPAEPAEPAQRPRRWLGPAMVVNAVLLSLIGIAAVVLLVVALVHG
ncbi:MAG: sigma-70 family RNA polymerase sigma factor [Thermoleophilaceae bacterium]